MKDTNKAAEELRELRQLANTNFDENEMGIGITYEKTHQKQM